MDQIFATIKAKKDDTYTIMASTDDIDRDGERILPSAFKNLDKYLTNNPVVLAFHDYKNFPIGKAVGGRILDRSLDLDIVFADTEQGREAKYLYDNKFLNAFSVGFIPKQWDTDKSGRIFTDVELLEVSAVPVPSNGAAIMRRAYDDGFEIKHFKKLLESKDTAEAETPEIKVDKRAEEINKLKRCYRWI
jgi:HK97 family phage prohead protease